MSQLTEYNNELARSSETIEGVILEGLKRDIPEITDWSEDNILFHMVRVMAGLTGSLHYYLDKKTQEAYLSTLSNFANAVRFAKAYDYRVRGASPAVARLRFYVDSPADAIITIPQGTQCVTNSGLIFETIEAVEIPILGTDVFVEAIQQEWVTPDAFVSDGASGQTIELADDGIVDMEVSVQVDGTDFYLPQDTLVFSNPNDLHFVPRINENGKTELVFGDGLNAVLVPNGVSIQPNYYVTAGADGNVGKNAIIRIITPLSNPDVLVTNPDPAINGANAEDLIALKKNIPFFIRSVVGACHEEQFEILPALVSGVASAGVLFNFGDTEEVIVEGSPVTKLKPVEVFIVPTTSSEASDYLINKVFEFMRRRTTINLEFRIKSVGDFRIQYEIEVEAQKNFQNYQVEQDVRRAVVAFQSSENQEVSGRVFFGEVYKTIEDVRGVSKSRLMNITLIPYAHRLKNTTQKLNWTRQILSTSDSEKTYRIAFSSDVDYTLFIDGVSQGVFVVGNPYTDTNVSFTILADSYTDGDEFEFKTYPAIAGIGDVLQLNEPSVPLSFDSDVIITVSGGLDTYGLV